MQEEEIKIDNETITEEQLSALYSYLSMTYNFMTQDEKELWYKIMKEIDKDFNDED